MSSQYDIQSGLDISSLASASQSQLLQMVNQLGPLSNIGGVICFDGLSAGAAGVGFPDMTNNPRFVRYIWLDTNPGGITPVDRSAPVFKRYVGAYTGTPANPSALSNLYTDWVAVGVANGAITTAMLAARSAGGGVDISKIKRQSDGSADATKAYYIVRVDSAGQYIEVVSLDTALGDGGGVGLNRVATTGIGQSKYLGYNAGVLGYKTIDPANDFTLALGNRIPITTAILPGTAKYIVRTNAAGTALEFVASNDATLFADLDILLSKLAASGAAANDIIKYNGANWVPVGFGSHLNAVGLTYDPGTALSAAARNIQTGALASKPKMYKGTVKCLSAELGYSVGDEIDIDGGFLSNNAGSYFNPFTLIWDGLNLKLTLWWELGATTNILQQKAVAGHVGYDNTKWAPKIYYWL